MWAQYFTLLTKTLKSMTSHDHLSNMFQLPKGFPQDVFIPSPHPALFLPSSPEVGRLQALGPVQFQSTPRGIPADGAAREGRKVRDLLIRVGKGTSIG